MQRLMSRHAHIALLLLAGALPCTAGAPVDHPPPGFHDVTIGSGDHKSVIRVADSVGPHLSGGSSSSPVPNAPYDPEAMNFNQSSRMADKTFNTSFASLSKSDDAAQGVGSRQFSTHSFATTGYAQAAAQYQTAAYKESARSGDEFGKTYQLPVSDRLDTESNRTFAVSASEFQGKTAAEAHTTVTDNPFATPSSLSAKTFSTPS